MLPFGLACGICATDRGRDKNLLYVVRLEIALMFPNGLNLSGIYLPT